MPSNLCLEKALVLSLCSLGVAYIILIPAGQSAAKLSISTNYYPFPPMSRKIIFNFPKPLIGHFIKDYEASINNL